MADLLPDGAFKKLARTVNDLVEKVDVLEESFSEEQVKMDDLEEKVKKLEEKVMKLEGDKDKNKKPERYTIATPATSSVVEGSVTSELSETQLMNMTKNQLFGLLSGHGKKVSNKKILKSDLAKLIIREGFNKPHDDNEVSLL